MSTEGTTHRERRHHGATEVATIAGLEELWAETLGDPQVCIAVLDGPVDLSHPCFAGAKLSTLPTLVPSVADGGPASQHGTHVASVIFGQHNSQVKGIAPQCRGLVIPIFQDTDESSFLPCSQVDLARAISQAVEAGANVINISGGQFSPSGAAHPILADVVKKCVDQQVLVVAAAGNQGCECLHIPGAIPSVLAVGAMNRDGDALDFSNWGYRTEGILAVGEGIRGAGVNGETTIRGGTSFATPIVSGMAGLLMSLLLKQGFNPSGHTVRSALLTTALGCEHQKVVDCDRLLAGRINVSAAVELIEKGESTMAHSDPVQPSMAEPSVPAMSDTCSVASTEAGVQPAERETPSLAAPAEPMSDIAPATNPAHHAGASRLSDDEPSRQAAVLEPSLSAQANGGGLITEQAEPSSSVGPSTCACGGSGAPSQLVFVLGRLTFDYGTLTRRNFFLHEFRNTELGDIDDPDQLFQYLTRRPVDDKGNPREDPYTIFDGNRFTNRAKVTSITWTLSIDETPIYAIVPNGAFAFEIHDTLVSFLRDQNEVEKQLVKFSEEEKLKTSPPELRVSIAGVTSGQVRLFTGETVPVISPDIRAMFSWTRTALVKATKGETKASQDAANDLAEFLHRVYSDTRNLGLTSEERALNYAVTNALLLQTVFDRVRKHFEGFELDTFDVQRSPVCRPNSDCWDVKLIFFNPKALLEARRAFRFTVDVTDVVPVMIGRRQDFSVR